MPHERDDFSRPTLTIIAQRAGYFCSFPRCRKVTVGPSSEPNKTASIGVAAHIKAAAPGGPRYDPSQTQAERRSADNGIWLCRDHATLIDSDVSPYSVEVLTKWKREHEDWVRTNIGRSPSEQVPEVSGVHIAAGEGSVTGLDIQGPAILKPGTRSIAVGWGEVTGTRIGSKEKPNRRKGPNEEAKD